MSYTPTNWQTGDTVTAERLNKMEQGIKNADSFIVTITQETFYVADKTYHQISDAVTAGNSIYAVYSGMVLYLSTITSSFATFAGTVDGWLYTFQINSDDTVLYYEDKIVNKPEFIIELTPTAQDFSGTMNKTPEEIYDAFQEWMRIVFYIPSMGATMFPQQFLDNGSSVVCAGQIVYDVGGQNVLIHIATSTSGQTYSTQIFPLTPMS